MSSGDPLHVWMLLLYQLPNKPTAGRVYVWRKLKKLGAVLLHDCAWALPASPHTREQLRWLATEIAELHGEASLWEAHQPLTADEEKLVARFEHAVDTPYRKLLVRLKRKRPNLAAISRQYQQIQLQDYFGSQMGKRVRSALLAAKGDVK